MGVETIRRYFLWPFKVNEIDERRTSRLPGKDRHREIEIEGFLRGLTSNAGFNEVAGKRWSGIGLATNLNGDCLTYLPSGEIELITARGKAIYRLVDLNDDTARILTGDLTKYSWVVMAQAGEKSVWVCRNSQDPAKPAGHMMARLYEKGEILGDKDVDYLKWSVAAETELEVE